MCAACQWGTEHTENGSLTARLEASSSVCVSNACCNSQNPRTEQSGFTRWFKYHRDWFFFFCNHNWQTLTCTCQSSTYSPNPSSREGGVYGFTLSRSRSCCAMRLVYTQISPGHIRTTLVLLFKLFGQPEWWWWWLRHDYEQCGLQATFSLQGRVVRKIL